MSLETIILVIALVIEVALAAYCIATRSNQTRVRSFVRVGTLVGFVVLTLASVIVWGLRWYLLALLLVVWSAFAASTLIRWKGERKRYGAGRTVLKAVGTMALVFLALIPAFVFPQYRLPQPTGTHPVATASYTYTDESRVETFANTGEKRRVNVEIWYPKDGGGKYPLVVFSHGAFGMKTSNTSTFQDLASNGYVVCSIDHPYHSLYTVGADGKATIVNMSFLQEVQDANAGKYDDASEIKIYEKWMTQETADDNFVLDTIIGKAESANADPVYQLVDTGKIGLFGHSMGGAGMVQVGRQRHDVDAVVNLDADLLGEYEGIANGKPIVNDAAYPVPILSIYSDDMMQLFSRVTDPATIMWTHVKATAPAAFETHITGTTHLSLTDVPLTMPILVTLVGDPKGLGNGKNTDPHRAIEIMNSQVLAFFDSYLKDKGAFTAAGTY